MRIDVCSYLPLEGEERRGEAWLLKIRIRVLRISRPVFLTEVSACGTSVA